MAESQIDILRDSDNFVNRYVEDVRSKEVLYYVEYGSDNTITVHRGHKDGPVVATAETCLDKVGSSKITMPESGTTIVLTHSTRRFSLSPPKTTLAIEGTDYEWKGYNGLSEKNTGRLIAQYSPVENDEKKLGELVFIKGDQRRTDMIIVSTLVLQQRAAARKRAVCPNLVPWN